MFEVEIKDASIDADGNVELLIHYPKTIMIQERVIIAKKKTAENSDPAVVPMTDQEYLDDALAKLKVRCEAESTREIDSRAQPDTAALVGRKL